MSQYDNNMRGIVSKNDRKEKDSHPDIKGQCEIDGVQFWISGWKKERKDGTGSFYSLSFEPKEGRGRESAVSQPARQSGGGGGGFASDDIPFAPVGMWE